ncbi:MAG: threonine/serine exporter family protein [Clostridiales bacterium]|jgi:uncharacterized membrane protein YjjB (DUF3815 family)|nr:threonine/serine exporter family protein [Clostridiales bacterium]MDR2751530.1 threonine/serine exporter family protein [Clostridiales bacterium]
MIIEVALAFAATFSFSCLFNIPKGELLFVGLTGALGWLVYKALLLSGVDEYVCMFAASVAVAWLSRIMTALRKMPLTVFLVGGIISLVPGAGIYNAILDLLTGGEAVTTAKRTAMLFAAICVGIIIVLSLPQSWFLPRIRRKPKS